MLGTKIVPVNVKSMISELLRSIMKKRGLKQQEFADLLGVPLQRVKRLVGGEAKKLTREEKLSLFKG